MKNKWYLMAGIAFILSALLNLLSDNLSLALMFLLIGLANCWLSTTDKPVSEKITDESIIKNDAKFIDLMAQGKTFKAMKQVRILSNCSLDDARIFVENIEAK